MPEASWIIILVVIGAIWLVKQRSWLLSSKSKQSQFNEEYFKGLNYLLNEQTDKAIEVFTRMLEVEKDTAEIHLALGNLFRRRGEVERSIRIHQNLIEKDSLNEQQRCNALIELANDYLRAGLLDRAETLLKDLIASGTQPNLALKYLAGIYEQEKDWEKAIEALRAMKQQGNPESELIAHYYCELAEEARQNRDRVTAQQFIQHALQADITCSRANLMLAELKFTEQDYQGAVDALKQVGKQHPELIGETLDTLENCYQNLNKPDELLAYLQEILPVHRSTRVIIKIADLMRQQQSDEAAVAFAVEQLKKRPTVRGLNWIININLEHSTAQNKKFFESLQDLTQKLSEDRPKYKCNKCGFSARQLYWQCPGCKHWNSIKPKVPLSQSAAAHE